RRAEPFEPTVSAVQTALRDVQLVAVALDQLFPTPVADPVGDRGADHVPEHTSKPANSIVGSDPGTPITPEVRVMMATPTTPTSRMMCVANVTSESVTEARAINTAGKRSDRGRTGDLAQMSVYSRST